MGQQRLVLSSGQDFSRVDENYRRRVKSVETCQQERYMEQVIPKVDGKQYKMAVMRRQSGGCVVALRKQE